MKNRKILSLLSVVAMMLAIVPAVLLGVSADTDDWTRIEIPATVADGDEYQIDGTTYRVIRSAAKLNELAAANTNCSYILANDLNYRNGAVTRIPMHDRMVFDGNGYSVSGFATIDGTNGWSLFVDVATENGTTEIKNLAIGAPDEKIVISAAGAGKGAGANGNGIGLIFDKLITLDAKRLIENVIVYADIGGITDQEYQYSFYAGFVGFIKEGSLTIRGCEFYGSVTSAGWNRSTAGFIGNAEWASEVTVEDCVNYGNMSAGTGSYAGGIVGYFEANNAYMTIQNCINVGKIESKGMAGGICGCNNGAKLEIMNCLNAGAIKGGQQGGGILGRKMNEKSSTAVMNCANVGLVDTKSTKGNGEIFGRIEAGTYSMINCLSVGAPASQKFIGFDATEEAPIVSDIFTDSKELMITATLVSAEQTKDWLKENITGVTCNASGKELSYTIGDVSGSVTVSYVPPVKPNDNKTQESNDTTAAPDNGTSSPNTDDTDNSKKGCSSTVCGGLAIVLSIGAAVCLKRKED